MHEETKNFLCHVCNFRHSSKAGLAAHVKCMHPKEKDMKMCHLCDYKTAVGHNLKVHIGEYLKDLKKLSIPLIM